MFGWVADPRAFDIDKFFHDISIFRIPVVSIVDHHRLFNRGFSFNFVSLVWAVFGGILWYTLKLNITIIYYF